MNFEQMKRISPELRRLQASVSVAGCHFAAWWDTWTAVSEQLSKLVGHGATDERLRSDHCYVVARDALHETWKRGRAAATAKPEPEHFPWSAGFEDEQTTFLDTSEVYR